ncbi:hypothetical protein B0H10DRAFT_1947378 [Mycena sp. CBHHK59/15]|nr:hypothetical protein B0H10DRAFT_1947378 [Mycena sp. CBHHK59/15]
MAGILPSLISLSSNFQRPPNGSRIGAQVALCTVNILRVPRLLSVQSTTKIGVRCPSHSRPGLDQCVLRFPHPTSGLSFPPHSKHASRLEPTAPRLCVPWVLLRFSAGSVILWTARAQRHEISQRTSFFLDCGDGEGYDERDEPEFLRPHACGSWFGWGGGYERAKRN